MKFSETESNRSRVYFAIAGLFFSLALVGGIAKSRILGQRFDLPVSDGRYYYAYLPTVAIDRDLDFSNQIAEHWGPDFHADLSLDRTETDRVRNKYPIGFALTVAPGFLIGHIVALASNGHIPADGYSWPYQVGCLAAIELLVWQTLVLADRIMTQRLHMSPNAAMLSLATVALGTPYAYYAGREPFMVHAVSAFWCTLVAAIASDSERQTKWKLPQIAFATSMAIVCRPTNLHLVPLLIFAIFKMVRGFDFASLLRTTPLALLAAAVPTGLQLLTWKSLSGNWIYFSYRGEGFDWTRPALWQTLFSSRHGLFLWSPVLVVACLGLMRRISNVFVASWSMGFLLLWYANSAWRTWWFGDSFGGRAFLELTGLFAIGLGLAFETMSAKSRIAVALLAVAFNAAFMMLYITHRIDRDGYLFGW